MIKYKIKEIMYTMMKLVLLAFYIFPSQYAKAAASFSKLYIYTLLYIPDWILYIVLLIIVASYTAV